MRKTLENPRGITLVALVITIIILLILAGISIQALTNTGLFGKAQEAKEKANLAQENEEMTLNEYLNEMKNQTETATAQIKMESVNFGIKATISCSNSNFNAEKSKFVFNTSKENLGLNEALYTEGNLTGQITSIEKAKAAGTYYLHVLLVGNGGEKNEYISSNSVTVASVLNFDYTGNKQQTSLLPGKYKLEVWGAQGGTYSSYAGGRGGYAVGNITLNKNTTLHLCVGGTTSSTSAGYNGGGSGISNGRGGGGATDIRIDANNDNNVTLYERIIVAGGGGGAGVAYQGGYGGGQIGGDGYTSLNRNGTGGTQTSAGTTWNNITAHYGSFGIGGSLSTGYSAGGGGRRLVWWWRSIRQ